MDLFPKIYLSWCLGRTCFQTFSTPFVSRTKKRRRQWQGQQDNNKTITTPTNTTTKTNRNVNLYNNFKYTCKIQYEFGKFGIQAVMKWLRFGHRRNTCGYAVLTITWQSWYRKSQATERPSKSWPLRHCLIFTFEICTMTIHDHPWPMFTVLLLCVIRFVLFNICCAAASVSAFSVKMLVLPAFLDANFLTQLSSTGPRALHRQVVSFKLVNQDVSVSRPWICSKHRGDFSQCCRVQ